MESLTMEFKVAFATVLLTELPFLLIAAVGLVLAWRRLTSEHAAARRWITYGLAMVALQCLTKGYVGAIALRSVLAYRGSDPVAFAHKLASGHNMTLWGNAGYVLLLGAMVCLVVAALSNRAPKQASASGAK